MISWWGLVQKQLERCCFQVTTIVIADDDVGFAETLNQLAQAHDHQVRHVTNGCDLLDVLEQFPAQICAIEVFLPALDGLELIPEICRRYPYTKIIAMCNGGIFGQDAAALFLRMARFLGAHGALVKPFDQSEFLSLVHALSEAPFSISGAAAQTAPDCPRAFSPDQVAM